MTDTRRRGLVATMRDRFIRLATTTSFVALASCGDGGADPPGIPNVAGDAIGATHSGQYHLGPVDFAETAYHNACAPYPNAIEAITGNMIAGVSNTVAEPGSYCDACIEVTTGQGRSAILRVVTYGVSNADGDLDLSPAAYDLLHAGEYPRAMSWHLVECDNGEPISLQFQTGANVWWTSLWVRNPSQAIARVDVRNAKYASYHQLSLGTDGTYTDANGFGDGPFTIRVTGESGATYETEVAGVMPGALIETDGNLPF